MNLDSNVRLAIYETFATTGHAPAVTDLAARLACSTGDIRSAYARLRKNRVLLLKPDGETIRMAPPFSGVPTPHRVQAERDRSPAPGCSTARSARPTGGMTWSSPEAPYSSSGGRKW